MENTNLNENEVKLLTKQQPLFWSGILLCVGALILFFVGVFSGNRNPLWIATAVVGGLSLIPLALSTHSVNGWTRMFSVFFMEILVVIGVIMIVSVA